MEEGCVGKGRVGGRRVCGGGVCGGGVFGREMCMKDTRTCRLARPEERED